MTRLRPHIKLRDRDLRPIFPSHLLTVSPSPHLLPLPLRVNAPFEPHRRNRTLKRKSEVENRQQKGVQMKRMNFAMITCVSALAVSAGFAQNQPEPFSPVTGVTTTPGTATVTTAVP